MKYLKVNESTHPWKVPHWYLYFTIAIAGAVVMIIEVLGANMLAPFMGASHFVWSAQIAVTLCALALGYYVGGYVADRTRRLVFIYIGILLAAGYLIVPALFREPVAFWSMQFGLGPASLLTATLLFFIPLFLLAAVGPYLIRFLTTSIDSVGSEVGRLTAIGTIGSLLGTLLVTYVMVPFFPFTISIYVTAALLIMIGAAYLASQRSKRGSLMVIVLVASGLSAALLAGEGTKGNRFKAVREIHRQNTHYGLLQVLESRNKQWRVLLSDFLVQNQYDISNGTSMSIPTYMLNYLSRAYTHSLQHALCIGLGAGVVPMQMAKEGIRVDVVEINPAMVSIAENFFGFQPERFDITIADARYFLNRKASRYDSILLDAFLGDASPAHLMTKETFSRMKAMLRPQGTVIVNTLGDFKSESGFFVASIRKTLQSVFRSVEVHAIEEDKGGVYFVASDMALKKNSYNPDWMEVHRCCRDTVKRLYEQTRAVDKGEGRVLTDDYNPMPFFDAKRRESLRRHFVTQLRNL